MSDLDSRQLQGDPKAHYRLKMVRKAGNSIEEVNLTKLSSEEEEDMILAGLDSLPQSGGTGFARFLAKANQQADPRNAQLSGGAYIDEMGFPHTSAEDLRNRDSSRTGFADFVSRQAEAPGTEHSRPSRGFGVGEGVDPTRDPEERREPLNDGGFQATGEDRELYPHEPEELNRNPFGKSENVEVSANGMGPGRRKRDGTGPFKDGTGPGRPEGCPIRSEVSTADIGKEEVIKKPLEEQKRKPGTGTDLVERAGRLRRRAAVDRNGAPITDGDRVKVPGGYEGVVDFIDNSDFRIYVTLDNGWEYDYSSGEIEKIGIGSKTADGPMPQWQSEPVDDSDVRDRGYEHLTVEDPSGRDVPGPENEKATQIPPVKFDEDGSWPMPGVSQNYPDQSPKKTEIMGSMLKVKLADGCTFFGRVAAQDEFYVDFVGRVAGDRSDASFSFRKTDILSSEPLRPRQAEHRGPETLQDAYSAFRRAGNGPFVRRAVRVKTLEGDEELNVGDYVFNVNAISETIGEVVSLEAQDKSSPWAKSIVQVRWINGPWKGETKDVNVGNLLKGDPSTIDLSAYASKKASIQDAHGDEIKVGDAVEVQGFSADEEDAMNGVIESIDERGFLNIRLDDGGTMMRTDSQSVFKRTAGRGEVGYGASKRLAFVGDPGAPMVCDKCRAEIEPGRAYGVDEGYYVNADLCESCANEVSKQLEHKYEEFLSENDGDEEFAREDYEKWIEEDEQGSPFTEEKYRYRVAGKRILKRAGRGEVGYDVPEDVIPGGLAAGRPDSDFDPNALLKGTEVEREQTEDPDMAREIAKDHLTEDPDYYEKLEVMEKSARRPELVGITSDVVPGIRVWLKGYEDEGAYNVEFVDGDAVTVSRPGIGSKRVPMSKVTIAGKTAQSFDWPYYTLRADGSLVDEDGNDVGDFKMFENVEEAERFLEDNDMRGNVKYAFQQEAVSDPRPYEDNKFEDGDVVLLDGEKGEVEGHGDEFGENIYDIRLLSGKWFYGVPETELQMVASRRDTMKKNAGIRRLQFGRWMDTNGNSYATIEEAAEAEAANSFAHEATEEEIEAEKERILREFGRSASVKKTSKALTHDEVMMEIEKLEDARSALYDTPGMDEGIHALTNAIDALRKNKESLREGSVKNAAMTSFDLPQETTESGEKRCLKCGMPYSEPDNPAMPELCPHCQETLKKSFGSRRVAWKDGHGDPVNQGDRVREIGTTPMSEVGALEGTLKFVNDDGTAIVATDDGVDIEVGLDALEKVGSRKTASVAAPDANASVDNTIGEGDLYGEDAAMRDQLKIREKRRRAMKIQIEGLLRRADALDARGNYAEAKKADDAVNRLYNVWKREGDSIQRLKSVIMRRVAARRAEQAAPPRTFFENPVKADPDKDNPFSDIL